MIKKDKKINKNKYVKSFYCQDYFLWHTEDEFKNKYMNTSLNEDEKNDDPEEDENEYWKIFLDSYEESLTSVNSPAKIFGKVEEQAYKWAVNELFKGLKIAYVSAKNKTEVKIEDTKKLLKDNTNDVVMNATIGYFTQNEFLVSCQIFAIDKKNKKVYLFKPSPKTTLTSLLEVDFAYNVLKKSGITDYENFYLIIIDNMLPLKRGESKFFPTENCEMAKAPSIVSDVKYKKIKPVVSKKGDYFKDKRSIESYLRKGLQFTNMDAPLLIDGESKKIKTIKIKYTDCIKRRQSLRKVFPEVNDGKFFFAFQGAKNAIFNEEAELNDFDETIKRIENAYKVKEPDFSYLNSMDVLPPEKNKDYSKFEKNNLLLRDYKKFLLGDEYIFNMQLNNALRDDSNLEISPYEKFLKFKINVKTANQINDFFNIKVIERYLSQFHIKDNKIVWYDYESFTSPLPIIDNLKPYAQAVNQVSIIETKNGKIIKDSEEDIVIDPQKIDTIDLIMILKNLYDRQGDYYVVYNKAFENSRNKEIAQLAIDNENDENFVNELKSKLGISPKDVKKYSDFIKNKTIDLIDLYKSESDNTGILIQIQNSPKNGYKPIYNLSTKGNIVNTKADVSNLINPEFAKKIFSFNIFLKDLKGMFSIKKVEKFITKNAIKLEHLIIPYSDLIEIQNGLNAMEAAIKRYCGLTGDNVWNETVKNLKKYCHNDVKAMIMAFNFVEKIVSDVFPEILKLRYTFDKNKKYRFNPGEWKIELL